CTGSPEPRTTNPGRRCPPWPPIRPRWPSRPTGLRVTWFGHSSTLLDIDGLRVLTDPLWSDRASPVEWAGPRRWYPPPIALAQLPRVDAVLISHDHYDHLDRPTVLAMREWTNTFIVPLGVGAHLERWGIPRDR
ncbi:MBL fold metallo-hydrolase, partial [Corallococcus coralloides]|nr:MBL fold metallo-hydrolase [Corallococcus coralloides]